jgi:hypothetical protein
VRIVLDTTILVRSTEKSHGPARDLLLNLVASEHTLLLSNEMLHELARVLRYPRLLAFYGLSGGTRLSFHRVPAGSRRDRHAQPSAHPAYSRCKRYRRPADSHTWRSEYPLHTRCRFLYPSGCRIPGQGRDRRHGQHFPTESTAFLTVVNLRRRAHTKALQSSSSRSPAAAFPSPIPVLFQ